MERPTVLRHITTTKTGVGFNKTLQKKKRCSDIAYLTISFRESSVRL